LGEKSGFEGGKMDINNITSGPVLTGAPKVSEKASVPAQPAVAPKAPPAEIKLPQTGDEVRYEEVKMAADAVKNLYAVSDTRFTIFKDLAGDYVTRFRSLRDGTVKYYPEKTLYELVAIRSGRSGSVSTDA